MTARLLPLAPTALLAAFWWLGCTAAPMAAPTDEEVEVAPLMGEIQRHTAKLGYSIAGRNQPLAAFYLEEIGEVMHEIVAVALHDGMPIGRPAEIIMAPLLEPLATDIDQGDWLGASERYAGLIDGCNRCHAATGHSFIEILEPRGPAPFDQIF